MARRAYGTGTLRVVGRSWIGSWYGPDGRRVQRKVGNVRREGRADGFTKPQAERVLRRMREIDAPRSAPGTERLTMEQAGAEFCQRLELKGRRKSHRLTVASDLRNHIAPFFAGKTLDRIRPEDIERYIAAKRGTLAIKTVRNHVNTMHSIFDLGLRKGWCSSNPVKLADRPTLKKTETRIQFLDQAELEQLLAAPYPDDAFGRLEPTLYLTAAMTGLRQGRAPRAPVARRRLRRAQDPGRVAVRPRRVRRPQVGRIGPLGADGRARRDRARHAARAVRLLARPRPRLLPPRHREPARPLEARPPLQAGDPARRGPPDHLPRAAPHLRHTDGGRRHSDAHASALDGPRGLEDHSDLRSLPAERSGGRRRRPGVRLIGRARR